ncbi:hypothetical protein CP532_2663 [Ophiocordyceps camponoti-leonardi (nom. inval.)]|nr:hypothetical protein CP532_2663 [Ophiocordyceps camponoti-leonardi (nom. inval.)]
MSMSTVIVPSEDSHSSEYIADCDARREFISGFTGSAGWAIVTRNAAALATDGRYFNQAYHELDDNWTLLKQGLQDVPTWQEWVADQSAGGKVVAVDPELITGLIAKKLSEQIRKAGGAELLPLQENLIDIVWANHRPSRPQILEDEKTFAPGNLAPQTFLMSNKGSWALQRALGGDGLVEESRSPVGDAKAIKNETETKGMRECHVRDGAALIEFFAWLEDQLVAKKARVDEVQAAEKLKQLRSRHRHFVGLSFPTISSTGPNAAVIHYDPEPGSCAVIDPQNVYLCDSGAQYLDGTTDTTRTLHFGTPSPAERKAYTLVLKGVIALDTAVFPKGTTGFALDCLARQFLWHEGLDYRHGTGHGVGSYLNVHEGPIGIGTRVQYAEVPLAPGNVLSNEPGYYEDGHFGIRIENIMLVREQQTEHCFGEKPFLGFEHVTMV